MIDRIEIRKTIAEHLHQKIIDGSINPDVVPELVSFIEEAIKERDDSLVSDLSSLIRTWEDSMGVEDKTLYTLGLRRVIDLVRNESHKPLNEDQRGFKL